MNEVEILQRYQAATKKLGELERQQVQAETQLQRAEEDLAAVLGQLQAAGVDPERLDAEINQLESQLPVLLAQVEAELAKAE